ncbi:immune inhibitor A domain-containing protein [Vallitalea okinawensis]|uniref:immune inhibitor A domain-containing protein n=1 Tax=Vallitalea okinawensis TaxID=2078660 RepID=UPI000CFC9121|nr:immune inhibitor A domain-containing protein [Vallitalea okinawensis]
MKKGLSYILILAFAISTLLVGQTSQVQAKKNDVSQDMQVLDIGPRLRHLENDEEYVEEVEKQIKKAAATYNFNEENTVESDEENSNFTFDGGTKDFLGYDSVNGYYFKSYTLRSVGENIEVWVADDLSFQDDRPAHVVTQEQVDTLRDEFDNNIYSTDTDFFGTPDSHDGDQALLSDWGYVDPDYYSPKDGIERIIMLVDNVRDENYYDPDYPFFIAGFYSSTFEAYFDRNIISLDTNSWEERLESTFFGTTAHELQHLIHDDNDSAEETWVNEGMSDFAEFLCGYGHPMGHVNFFIEHPENSLVEWDDHLEAVTGPETLADYGQAYLLQLYLYDHYGKDFIQQLAKETKHGFEGVEKVLDDYNTGIDFSELFRRFSIAVAIDSPEPDSGIYNFDSIDINVNYESALAYDKDGVPAWGGDYKEIDQANKIQSIKFDGINFLQSPWQVVQDPTDESNQVFWANKGDEMDSQIIISVDLKDVNEATLSFDHLVEIEQDWDFAFVQVSTDGGDTWNSLMNESTVDSLVPEGYPAIRENLPGFTGHTNGWTTEEFDLTPYIGKEILLNFRYMTDWGTNENGWYIDDISIPEINLYFDGSDLEEFKSIHEVTESYVEYAVTFINQKSLGKGNNNSNYKVLSIDPFDVTEADAITLKEFFSGGNNYMVIWYAAPAGTKGEVDYSYEITTKSEAAKQK